MEETITFKQVENIFEHIKWMTSVSVATSS